MCWCDPLVSPLALRITIITCCVERFNRFGFTTQPEIMAFGCRCCWSGSGQEEPSMKTEYDFTLINIFECVWGECGYTIITNYIFQHTHTHTQWTYVCVCYVFVHSWGRSVIMCLPSSSGRTTPNPISWTLDWLICSGIALDIQSTTAPRTTPDAWALQHTTHSLRITHWRLGQLDSGRDERDANGAENVAYCCCCWCFGFCDQQKEMPAVLPKHTLWNCVCVRFVCTCAPRRPKYSRGMRCVCVCVFAVRRRGRFVTWMCLYINMPTGSHINIQICIYRSCVLGTQTHTYTTCNGDGMGRPTEAQDDNRRTPWKVGAHFP